MINIAFESVRNKVLLIEDDPADTIIIKAKLEQLFDHLEVETAPSLREAYKISGNKNFNFILLDLNLPDGFGPNSVADIMKFQKDIPIIVFTGYANKITIDEALKLGASEVIQKEELMSESFKEKISKYLQ